MTCWQSTGRFAPARVGATGRGAWSGAGIDLQSAPVTGNRESSSASVASSEPE